MNLGCFNKTLDEIAQPIDKNSLYAQRLYDTQRAHVVCGKSEGFSSIIPNTNQFVFILSIVAVAYLVYMMYGNKRMKFGLDSLSNSYTDI